MLTNRTTLMAFALTTLAGTAVAGPLTPPSGPITSTMKTMAEVEPRIAINAINTPGDNDATPSLFKITQPGSYYLTGNITGVSGKYGIEIVASGVTIDLNGFELFGGGSASGSLDGIRITGNVLVNTSVKNGSIRGWGGHGIDLVTVFTSGGSVTDIAASENGMFGLRIGQRQVAERCTAFQNGGNGISASTNCIISHCTATSNGGIGISSSANTIIAECVSANNGNVGIYAIQASTVRGCNVLFNTLDGIRVGADDCVVIGNNTSGNGFNGDGAGIRATGNSNRIEGNNCSGADRGIQVDGSNSIIIKNTCSGNTVNWVISSSNVYGPIVDRAAPAGAAVNGSAATSTLGTTDPNANFSY